MDLSPALGPGGDPAADGLVGQAGLPALDNLGAPKRQVDMLGPGFVVLDPQETIGDHGTAIGPGAALTLNAVGDTSFAIYGVGVFDGDNGPTSGRITVGSLTGGQYFVGFSDFAAGVWRFSGPFSDSAEIEIHLPGGDVVDQYTNPNAFVSPSGICYLAIVLPVGGVMTLTGVEIGVHGGTLGPAPPWNINGQGGANGFGLHWTHSPNFQDPDFAGYLIDRAPLLSGDFARLNPDPVPNNSYIDATAVVDEPYRYRIAAIDASGNQSTWMSFNGGPATGDLALPVAVLKLPRGPFHGPTEVKFDLSQSYDPEGIGIASYSFVFLVNPASVSGASKTCTATMQPGCHIISASVQTTDGRVGSTFGLLKVYPVWSEGSVRIEAPDPLLGIERLRYVQTALDGRLIFGYDTFSSAFEFWYDVDGLGIGYQPSYLPCYFTGMRSGEPVEANGSVIVPVATDQMFFLAKFTPPTGPVMSAHDFDVDLMGIGLDMTWTAPIAAATDGDKIWVFTCQDSGGVRDLTVTDSSDFGTTAIVAPNIGSMNSVDAIYDASRSLIHVIYTTGGTTEYIGWDPATQAAVGGQNLSPGWGMYTDVELNPVNNNLTTAYFNAARVRFREWDGVAWGAEELVDNVVASMGPFDLAYSSTGNPFVYAQVAPNTSLLYERTAPATWGVRNPPVLADNSGFEVNLTGPFNDNEFLATDRDTTGRVNTVYLDNTGAGTVRWSLAPGNGLGHRIQATAGTADGTESGPEVLHTTFLNIVGAGSDHYTSSDGGATWDPQPTVAYQYTDLTGTLRGEVYLSSSSFAGNELFRWNQVTTAWDACFAAIPGDAAHVAFLDNNPLSADIMWKAYDPGGNILHSYVGNLTDGFVDTPINPSPTAIWFGAVVNVLGSGYLTLANGATVDDGHVIFSTSGGINNTVAQPLLASTAMLFSNGPVRQRGLAAAAYFAKPYFIPRQVYWSAQGQAYNAVRYETDVFEGNPVTDLEMSMAPLQVDMRRTASALIAPGVTAVGFVASIDGVDQRLEWSNYGDWEELPVPPNLDRASSPELLLGRDGRWHIIYRDWATDSVYCLSTVP